jgi:hypothetical protein
MKMRLLLVALLPLVTLAAATAPTTTPSTAPATAPATAAAILPIRELQGITANESAFNVSGSTKPLVLKSEKDATDYFSKEDLAKLTKQVDFKSQIVLLFAWQGSGQDKLDYTVAESYPEQIKFSFTPGRTKDLRTHMNLYVLRSNVVWSVK